MNTPILFLVFNRPETTKLVFERIKEVQPKFLYVAADGPRLSGDDSEKCESVRKMILDNIDWDCNIKVLFREKNMGCKYAVSSAITWFFDNEEEGIILEDDVLPDKSFFEYCTSLLKHYRYNEKVMLISGFNAQGYWKQHKQPYHFSNFGSIWGWASWRRAWRYYDVDIKKWAAPSIKEHLLRTYFPKVLRNERMQLYNDLYDGKINTWDYQWTLCRLMEGGVSIVSAKNTITNIGFNSAATHAKQSPAWLINNNSYAIDLPIKFLRNIKIDKTYDNKMLRLFSGRPKTSGPLYLLANYKKKILALLSSWKKKK